MQQFTDQERALAEDIRQDIIENGRKSISDHCQDAMDETGASVYDLAESLRHGIIIELSRQDSGYRIVTRLDRGGTAHCAVFSEFGAAVTYWINGSDDRHETLNLGKYNRQAFV